jgi:hypothetical protein
MLFIIIIIITDCSFSLLVFFFHLLLTANVRQGVCFALAEVIGNTKKSLLTSYTDAIVPTIKRAVCDNSSEVREAAAVAFDTLYKTVGVEILDQILNPLLEDLQTQQPLALEALKQILLIRSNVVLPFLVPKLMT